MINALILVLALVLAGGAVFSKRLGRSLEWQAMITPLASIMGSGFLISAPLMADVAGNFAVFCMGGLLVLAYLVGSAIRFNIKFFEPIEHQEHGLVQEIALASEVVLTGAYLVSVSYYLQLLAAFMLNALGFDNPFVGNVITTCLLLFIGCFGIFGGIKGLEGITRYTVGLNLGVIGAMLAGLVVYNGLAFFNGTWHLQSLPAQLSLHKVQVILGLLIVVQGFETSRYIGDTHPADQRIRTMRSAQLLSAAIYIVFISLATVLFQKHLGADVTAIMEMTRPVAVVLPILLGVAAIGSQFSAAVADSTGAGGLVEDISHNRLSMKSVYLLLVIITVGLTWGTNVVQIISYASRAFSLYYALQCMVSLILVWENKPKAYSQRPARLVFFGLLTLICLLIFFFGIPAE